MRLRSVMRSVMRSVREWDRYDEHPRFMWAIVIFILVVFVIVTIAQLTDGG